MSTSAVSDAQRSNASQGYRVLDIIRQYAPHITWRTTSNPRSKYTMKCPLCDYDSRSGVNKYFTVHENEQLWSCQVCGATGNAYQLLKLLTNGHNFSPHQSFHRTIHNENQFVGGKRLPEHASNSIPKVSRFISPICRHDN